MLFQLATFSAQRQLGSQMIGRLRLLGLLGVLLGAIAACTPTVSNSPSSAQPDAVPETTATSSPQAPPEQSAATEPVAETDLCDDPQTQIEMNQCAQQAYKQADAELNQVYKTLHASLSDSGKQRLTDAELAWVSFRDLDCDFARDQYEGGAIAPLIYYSCLEDLTELRTTELEETQLPKQSYETADAQLNRAYQDLLTRLREERGNDFVSAQIAWIEYRDRNCEFEVLYGVMPIEESQCLARMSTARTDQILTALAQNSL